MARGRLVTIAAACALLVMISMLVYWLSSPSPAEPPAPVPSSPAPSPSLSEEPSPSPTPSASPSPTPIVVPARGSGTFSYATTGAERVGDRGHLVRYTVATENGSGIDPETFASAVHATLADPRSWLAGGRFSFQRVPAGTPSELTVHLATPATTDTMCGKHGVRTRGEVSCRGGRDVVINLKRWLLGVAWYPQLEDYRDMVVNHEVGHFLGNGHVVCPRKGAPAPVMARQTFGLEGCVVNPWPYPDGKTLATGPQAPR
ncbi:DUF3152 domain-containing protein [Dactylosporangium sp. AC04546]|uniref:DUF3152 domain-containing protein n=1 Tax=Dactylosporangium sp. AC04546 TaxID=2862460 RepID=UPI001EDE3E72|nr:DUF3152 domain-containing protein [Dactylosporangium sp. AC04546]WVK84833.1 DUF3152 domain-containing protein [Dactylosporangium sp. AC04546]